MSMKTELWQAVIRAIEAAIPEYDAVNEKVSLNRAMKARRFAVDQLELGDGMVVLDAGIGPGSMSEALLSKSNGVTVVGLDASVKLLHAGRNRLRPSYNDQLYLVRGAFEALPFKDRSINKIVSAYAFRDSRNRTTAIEEFHRVSTDDAAFAIVDLGKPDNLLKRAFITSYVRYFMPLIARFSKSKRISGNPWQMIFPTYELLETNHNLVQSLKKRFAEVTIWEFSLGGLIVILAQKARVSV